MLGHTSTDMTLVYAYISDRAMAEDYAKMFGPGAVVAGPIAEQLRSGTLPEASGAWLKTQLLEFSLLGWVFSWLLNLVAGYGERPVRSFIAYLLVLFGFAGAYFAANNGLLGFGTGATPVQPLQWYEALVLSVSSFHGRGFFQPVQSLGDPVAILAVVEAVMGLFIEITFIATFMQRFFGGR
jgi:hypothetical protein